MSHPVLLAAAAIIVSIRMLGRSALSTGVPAMPPVLECSASVAGACYYRPAELPWHLCRACRGHQQLTCRWSDTIIKSHISVGRQPASQSLKFVKQLTAPQGTCCPVDARLTCAQRQESHFASRNHTEAFKLGLVASAALPRGLCYLCIGCGLQNRRSSWCTGTCVSTDGSTACSDLPRVNPHAALSEMHRQRILRAWRPMVPALCA